MDKHLILLIRQQITEQNNKNQLQPQNAINQFIIATNKIMKTTINLFK